MLKLNLEEINYLKWQNSCIKFSSYFSRHSDIHAFLKKEKVKKYSVIWKLALLVFKAKESLTIRRLRLGEQLMKSRGEEPSCFTANTAA